MSNGKLLTLFLDYENELRATMPDFAHQLSSLLNVPPKSVDYSKKAVAEYENFDIDTSDEDELVSEETMDFHDDFEKNIMFLMGKSDATLASVFENHFDHGANRDTMIAQLADNFSTDELKSNFTNIEMHCGVDPKKKKKPTQLLKSEVDTDIKTHCGVEKKTQLIEMQFCETCDTSHADHFRFCDLCNEEHDGCCDIYA